MEAENFWVCFGKSSWLLGGFKYAMEIPQCIGITREVMEGTEKFKEKEVS